MDVLRPSHSLRPRASGLSDPYRRSRPPREARRNMDTQSDIFPGFEVDIEEVHHAHLLFNFAMSLRFLFLNIVRMETLPETNGIEGPVRS